MKKIELFNRRLYRLILIKTKRNYIFGLSLHHIITDALAVQEVIDQIQFSYNNPEKSIEKKLFNESELASQLEMKRKLLPNYSTGIQYWVRKLDLSKPDSTFTQQPSNIKAERVDYFLSDELNPLLKRIKDGLGVSLFNIITAVTIISRWYCYGLNNQLIPYSVNTRSSRLNKSMGYFVNTLPLYCEFKPEQTFHSLITSLKTERLTDREYQTVALLDILKNDSDKRLTDKITAGLNFTLNQFTYLSYNFELNKCECIPIPRLNVELSNGAVLRYDLQKRLQIEIDYNLEWYSRSEIQGFIHCFNDSIWHFSQYPESIISDYMNKIRSKYYA